MVSIEIAHCCTRARAERFASQIDGQSYMSFQTTICPFRGEYVVNVETTYTDDAAEVQDMLNYVMFCAIAHN
jgi:hypothetical protein